MAEQREASEASLSEVVVELVFDGDKDDFKLWQESPAEARRLVWEAKTERRKLSTLAEEFFRRLAKKHGGAMLLKKGELHGLVALATLTPAAEAEVRAKLDLLEEVFQVARVRGEQTAGTE
jgi:hypothetical protein